MSILGDIVNIRGALQAQRQAAAMNPLQLQQAQIQAQQMQMLMKQYPQVMGLLGLGGSSASAPQGATAQPQGGLLGASLPAIPNIPAFPAQLGQPMTGDGTTQQAQQPQQGLLGPSQPQQGLLGGVGAPSTMAPRAAAGQMPSQGQLPQGRQATMVPQGQMPQGQSQQADPWDMIRRGTALQGSMIPFAQKAGIALVNEGKTMLANNPQYVTQAAVARSPLTIAQAQYQQALSDGDPQSIQRAYTNMRNVSGQEHVGSMSGIMTMQLPNGNWATFNPSTGLQTIINPQLSAKAPEGAAWLPGEVNAIRTRAAAEAGGEGAGQAPYDLEKVTDQKGNEYLVPKAQLLAPGTPGGVRPPGVPNAPALTAVGPQTASALSARGTQSQDYVMTSQKAADDATTANYALDNVIQAARGASIGPGAPAREFVEKQFSVLGQSLLGSNFQPPKELGSYQELEKYGNQLGFATARTMGSREAAQIVNMAIQSNPNKSLTPAAFGWIANSMKAMNNYVIAKNQALQAADRKSPGSAQQAGSTWDAQVNPQVWDLALDPGMAAQLAPKLGAQKIATALPFMSSADAVSAFRNIPASLRAAVLAKMPAATKQELAAGLQQ